jgi:hypothetical protein
VNVHCKNAVDCAENNFVAVTVLTDFLLISRERVGFYFV